MSAFYFGSSTGSLPMYFLEATKTKKKPKEKIDAWFVSVGACMTAWGRRQ